MDRVRFSAIGHATHRYCNPISTEKMERLLGVLDLRPGAKVIDLGCGKAELLVRLAERYRAECVGVDLSGPFLAAGRRRLEEIDEGAGHVRLIEGDATTYAEGAPYDLAINFGATYVHDGFAGTLDHLASIVRPGGELLVADGIWKREPDPAHLAAFGATREEARLHHENVALAASKGLTTLCSCVASDDEWDDYEGRYWRNLERHLAAHPEEPRAWRERLEQMRDSYFTWRRDTMGFAVYLFRRP